MIGLARNLEPETRMGTRSGYETGTLDVVTRHRMRMDLWMSQGLGIKLDMR